MAAEETSGRFPKHGEKPKRVLVLTLRGEKGFDLASDRIEKPDRELELLCVRKSGEVWQASFRAGVDGLSRLTRMIQDYVRKTPRPGKKRRYQDIVDSISEISVTDIRDLWTDDAPLPAVDESLRWEIWLYRLSGEPQRVFDEFRLAAKRVQLRPADRYMTFPERIVTIAFGTSGQLERLLPLFDEIAELRRAAEPPTEYTQMPARFQQQYVAEFRATLRSPKQECPSVALLDQGVHRGHALIEPFLAETDVHGVSGCARSPGSGEPHGTEMAGLALYGASLADQMQALRPTIIRHRLESAKIFPNLRANEDQDAAGVITQEAVSLLEIAAPHRRRTLCMAITTDQGDQGRPSSWSAAIDSLTSGAEEVDRPSRLFLIAAGNYRDIQIDTQYKYFKTNCRTAPIENPAQAWNAVTVGACTDRTVIEDPEFNGWECVAGSGQLCPTSRTSWAWPEDYRNRWPVKPDIVMEGGNYAHDGAGRRQPIDDLGLLTTSGGMGAAFGIMSDTSAATACAARLAANLWSHYPTLWPETIRGLLVHSARWTPGMLRQIPDSEPDAVLKRLRCFGYGVPNETRALWSMQNAATLLKQGEIQPYRIEHDHPRANEMHLYRLPWPKQVLEDLGNEEVTLRITLSYFIEPNPGRRWTYQHRYASHGLRFAMNGRNELERTFRRRLSQDERDLEGDPIGQPERDDGWAIGSQQRRYGSLHCDWWKGPAINLALRGLIAVLPVTGWWRERPHVGRVQRKARYSIIVSLETEAESADLYAPIEAQIKTPIQVEL